MSAASFQFRVLEFDIHGVLFAHHGGDGLKGNAEVNCFAVGNAALNAARTVCGRANLSAFHAGLSTPTVSNFERRIGPPKFWTEERIKSALERAGIVFLQDDDGGIGVALTNAM